MKFHYTNRNTFCYIITKITSELCLQKYIKELYYVQLMYFHYISIIMLHYVNVISLHYVNIIPLTNISPLIKCKLM